ncbi:MAG TPA: chemotaxis response regulator protein-glutamate methylesterase [Candidatus Atribacteria bacterium]|nr:chemotaxis response regulator protein-glutamate methylesterase [Candidatus Atribacteria bacterium]
MLKVLIVDDSSFMRMRIRILLESDPDIEIVGIARDGFEAIEKTRRLKPDVITMDLKMPGMSGTEAVERIMRENPTPVIMISSFTFDGAQETVDALSRGAVDYIQKESITRDELLRKVYTAQKAHLDLKKSATTEPADMASRSFSIVGIGISTGGPKALAELLPAISPDIDASIVIAQHMPPAFTASLAVRLDQEASITVKEAEDGEVLKPAHAYICPGGMHMTVTAMGTIALAEKDRYPDQKFSPSVDLLMASLGEAYGDKAMCIIMTGMGSDGVEGVKAARQRGSFIAAQSEDSCTIYGMPKAVVESGLHDRIIHLDDIARHINVLCKKK